MNHNGQLSDTKIFENKNYIDLKTYGNKPNEYILEYSAYLFSNLLLQFLIIFLKKRKR